MQSEKELYDMNMKQEFIECDKIWDDTEILIPSVNTNYESIFEEHDYNNIKYETNDLSSPKDIKETNEKNEQDPFKVEDGFEVIYMKKEINEDLMIKNGPDFIYTDTQSKQALSNKPYFLPGVESIAKSSDAFGRSENGLEDICVKKEITEELILKDESDFIQIETQENTESKQLPDNNVYYLTEVESISGSCAVNKHGQEGENRLEDIWVKKEITEELILKDESDFLQIETQENTESKQLPDSNKYYLTEVESISGPCAVNKYGKNGLEDICVKKDITHELILKDESDFIQIETQENAESKQLPDSNVYYLTESISGPCAVHKHDNVDLVTKKRIQNNNKSYTCDVCKKIFHHGDNFQEHQRIHTGEKPHSCDICMKTFNQKQHLDKHKRFHTGEKPYECDICKKTFSTKVYLMQHKRIHTGEKSYACDICGKIFNHKCSLKKHKCFHTAEKSVTCEVCEKKFSSFSALILHKRIHTGEKPYACDVCEKTFNQKPHLDNHKIFHTGAKPYECDICKKTFNVKSNLISHKIIHTSEKPYACDVCEKTFNFQSNLIKHKSIHTGKRSYTCNICKKTFSQKGNLKQHERIHSGEKPYSCDICMKTFNQKPHLDIHKRSHTGEKPYACDVCGKIFSHKCSLNKHKRLHTGEKPYTCDV